MALSTVMLVCDLVDGRGQPVSFGSVKLTPNTTLTDPGDQVIVTQQTVEVPFSAEGSPSVVLLATDDAGLSPSGWTWGASFNVTGGPSSFSFFLPAGPVSFTATDASPAVFTFTPTTQLTELPDGTIVELSGGSLPAGFTAATPYYVVAASGHTFQLSATAGGSAIASTSTGSGTAQVTQWRLSAIAPTGTVPLVSDYLLAANNLSDVDSPSAALANLGGASTGAMASAQAAAIAASARLLIPTAVKTSAYAASPGDFVPVSTTSGAVTVTLPTAPADKATIGVKLITQSGSNAVTITAGGSDVFNKASGATSETLTLVNQGMVVQYAATPGIWYITTDDLALSSLDTRYNAGASGINAAAYGVVADGTTDCTTQLQAAVNAALATQQGSAVVNLPPGAVVVSATIQCSSATVSSAGRGVYFRGSGRGGSQILKASGFSTGPSLQWQGYGGPAGFPSSYGGLIDVAVEGHFLAGGLVELDSCQQMYFRGASMNSCAATALVLNTVQDTYFSQCTLATNGSTTAPAVLITGSSGGSSNMIWFSQCRLEDFINGAVWIKHASGQTLANNGHFFSQCKFETTKVNGDLIVADTYTQQLSFDQVFLAADSFNSGYSTPCNGITYGDGSAGSGLNQASFRDVFMHGSSSVAAAVINVNGTNMSGGPVTIDSIEWDGATVVPVALASMPLSLRVRYSPQGPVDRWFTAKSGSYVQGQASVSTSATLGNGSLRLAPLLVTQPVVVTAIGSEFTAAGDAASILHLGIYADDGTGYPGALLLDAGSISTGSGNAGTVATGGTPGVYMITLGSPLVLPPGMYWLGGAVQGVTVTQPTIRTGLFGTQFAVASSGVPGAGVTALCYSESSVTGALPTPFVTFASATPVSSAPRVIIRIQ